MTAEARGARYSTLAIVLHWTIAALIILQINKDAHGFNLMLYVICDGDFQRLPVLHDS